MRCIFDVNNKLVLKENLVKISQKPDFWNDNLKAKEIQTQIKRFEADINKINLIKSQNDEIETIIQLLETENDQTLSKELEIKYPKLLHDVDAEEFNLMLSGKYDRNNAIVILHSGAGGTESCDWVSMLLRMYMMWTEKKGFKTYITDIQPGEEAGIKSVTFEAYGDYAYGHFRAEKGVHRLVRISPFDSNKRRHTSFASVEVIPEIDEDIEIEIKEEDLKVDTYRASGAGGQHVNKTESAVRITHIPTNIIVQCQTDRSQIKNREICMKILKSKLFAYYEEQKKEEMDKITGEKKSIGWSSQIRSYVFHPYKMIKDLRTDYERSDVDNVMDGDLDEYIHAFLKMDAENKKDKTNA